MMAAYVRAEELARAVQRLPDPDRGPPIVEIPVEPFRRLSTTPIEDPDEMITLHLVRFRRETFAYGSKRWREYVLDLTPPPTP